MFFAESMPQFTVIFTPNFIGHSPLPNCDGPASRTNKNIKTLFFLHFRSDRGDFYVKDPNVRDKY